MLEVALGLLPFLAIVFLVIDLSFDAGRLYLIRTKLSAAVDAAVLAGAGSLNRALDRASQIESARATAIQYFDANFSGGFFGTEWTLTTSNTSGCAFAAGSGTSFRRRARRDIAFIPNTDLNGISMWGYKPFSAPGDLYPNGHPCAGRIRVVSSRAMRHAAYNQADNAAQ